MDKIHICGLELHCTIGTRPVERTNRQKIVLDITLECDFSKAAETDELSDTVNYKDLKDRISGMVEVSSFFLLEKLAEEVASMCLATPGVESVSLAVYKPGALAGASNVGVEITRRRKTKSGAK
jgi:FolB domain-containing protein